MLAALGRTHWTWDEGIYAEWRATSEYSHRKIYRRCPDYGFGVTPVLINVLAQSVVGLRVTARVKISDFHKVNLAALETFDGSEQRRTLVLFLLLPLLLSLLFLLFLPLLNFLLMVSRSFGKRCRGSSTSPLTQTVGISTDPQDERVSPLERHWLTPRQTASWRASWLASWLIYHFVSFGSIAFA